MSSELQQDASRSNGAKSHGALSPETQAICAKNSLKHGLTAKTLSLTEEEREDYTNLVNITFNHYRPISSMEKHVIQSVADLEWKIVKADIYEAGILANGHMSNREDLKDVEPPEHRFLLIEGLIYQTYAKVLQNLTLQRSRIQRDLERRIKQFEAMRAEREVVEVAQRNIAVASLMGKPDDKSPVHPSVGSVFSHDYLLARVEFEKSVEKRDKKNIDLKLAIFDRTWGCKSLNFRP
jgi:hypothetical protein